MSDHKSIEELFSKSNVCNDNIFTIGTTVDTGLFTNNCKFKKIYVFF